MSYEDGVIASLFRQAIVRRLEQVAELASDKRRMLWDATSFQARQVGGEGYQVHESALLTLRLIGGKHYVIVKPSLFIKAASGGAVSKDVERGIKQEMLSGQYNAGFNTVMEGWRARLFPKGRDTLEYPGDCGSTFRFRLSRVPVFVGVGMAQAQRMWLREQDRSIITETGFALAEPSLVFANRHADSPIARDIHPIRGILENRPFDYGLTRRGLADRVTVGMICPEREGPRFARYFGGLFQQQSPSQKERDYLIDFPGFQSAFGLDLSLPTCNGSGWATCLDPPDGLPVSQAAHHLAQNIIQCIETLRACASLQVLLICTPTRWQQWRRVQTDGEMFDLHNFVKAYCVRRGIATQFFDEDTIEGGHQCRVFWWLSLALYVKSMRTPWVLDSLDKDTAFIGLGFSINPGARRGEHITLGCSHIYSARGEGLQYRLSKIENALIRGNNAFMSYEDARRVGDSIRQLAFEAMGHLPKRVVIHKRTPFLEEERNGLLQGLAGVKSVDMIELTIEKSLRFVNAVTTREGRLAADGFPVRRGTTVLVDKHTALLWAHGVTASVNPKFKYYQGKRRIPAPLVVKRHVGTAPLAVLTREILGLTKMNWNTFDMYTKAPATIQSSNEIARIGSLLEHFGDASYDYRLFM